MKNLRAVVLVILGLWIALPCSAQWSGDRGSGGRDRGYERGERAHKGGGGNTEKPPAWDLGSAKSDGGGPAPQQESSRRGAPSAPASQSNGNSRSGDKPAPAAKSGSAKSPPSSSEPSDRPDRKLLDLKNNKKS